METVKLKIELEIDLTQEDIDDIMCTALEGGINYWCGRAEVVGGKYLGEYASEQIARGGSLKMYDIENGDSFELTFEKLLSGIKQAAANKEIPIEDGEIDICDIDADTADLIVQYALFGELVYC